MTYVPIVTPPPEPSPRARELARAVAQLIEEFGRRFPDTSATDIRQALHLAARQTAGSAAVPAALAAVLGIVFAAAGVLFLVFRGSGGGSGPPLVLITLVGAAIVAGLVAVMAGVLSGKR